MVKKRAAVCGALAALTLATAGCGKGMLGGGGEEDKTGPIVLGMVVPLSGSEAAFGGYMRNGAQLAIDEINANGGVLGRQLRLRAEDDSCDPQKATAAAKKLVTARIVASVGGFCSKATLPTMPVFSKAEIPMVIPAANSNELVAQENKYAFLINGTGTQQSAAAMIWITKSGAKRVAVMHDNTSYSKDIAVLTEQPLDQPGGPDKAVVEAISPGEADYSANINRVLTSKPDFVYFTGYVQEGGLLVRQFREAGYDGKFMVADGAVGPKFAEIGGKDAEGAFATMTLTPDTIQGAEGWVAAYKKKFGADPGPYSPQSYDAVRIVVRAIKNAGRTDGQRLVAALETLDGFPAFSGPIKFRPDHTLYSSGFVILVVKDGKFVLQDRLS